MVCVLPIGTSCAPLFPEDRVRTCSAGDVSEYFGSESPSRGLFFLSKEGLIHSDGDFCFSISIQGLVDAREVQLSVITLEQQQYPHADHHALRAGPLP
jgi:hypothetical protein